MEQAAKHNEVYPASFFLNSLTGTRLADKYKAVEILHDPSTVYNVTELRNLLIKALSNDYYVGKESEQEEPDIAQTRTWLLGSLAHICKGDDEAEKFVIKHLDKNFEWYAWCRYWVLEGLIGSGNINAEKICREQLEKDDDLIVSTLAAAYLASLNDKESVQRIKKDLVNTEKQWFVFRALRTVPLQFTITTVSKIVEEANNRDETYDAIIALGKIPPEWHNATVAAQALSSCIIKMRSSPWKDGLRTAAVASLGNLKVESAGHLVIEEIADNNPAIAREAARSIQKILGLSRTVTRIIEAASSSSADGIEAYARALRWLDRKAVAEELEQVMVTGTSKQQDVARTLLSEIGGTIAFEKLRARTDAMKQYTDVLEKTEDKVRILFEGTVIEAQKGFHVAVIMDEIVFAIGVLLLLGSAGYALFSSGTLDNWAGVSATGGLGVLGIIYGTLIANPRKQVRESVDHLMKVKIIFLAYLRRLHQTDQAYTRRMLDSEIISIDQVQSFANIVGSIMNETIQQHIKNGNTAVTLPKPEDAEAAAQHSLVTNNGK